MISVFNANGSHHMPISNNFTVRKNEWETKEDAGKSIKNT